MCSSNDTSAMSAECDNEGCRNVRANFDKLRRETILMSRINTQKEADANELKEIKKQMVEYNALVESLRAKNYELTNQERVAKAECERAKKSEAEIQKQMEVMEAGAANLRKKAEASDGFKTRYKLAAKILETLQESRIKITGTLEETVEALKVKINETKALTATVEELKTDKSEAMARIKLYKKHIPNLFKLLDELIPQASNLSYHTGKRIETYTSAEVRTQLLQGVLSASAYGGNHDDTSDEELDDITALISNAAKAPASAQRPFKTPFKRTPEKVEKKVPEEVLGKEKEPIITVPVIEQKPTTSRKMPVFETRGKKRVLTQQKHNVEAIEKAMEAKIQQKLTRNEEENEKRSEIAGGHNTIHGKKGPTVREQQSGMMSVKEKVAMMREEGNKKGPGKISTNPPPDQPSTSKASDPFSSFEPRSPPRAERQRTLSEMSHASDMFGLRLTPSPSASPQKTTPSGSLQNLADEPNWEQHLDEMDYELPAYFPLEAGPLPSAPSMPRLDAVEVYPTAEEAAQPASMIPIAPIASAPSMPHLDEAVLVEERPTELMDPEPVIPHTAPAETNKMSPRKVQFQISEKSPSEPLEKKKAVERTVEVTKEPENPKTQQNRVSEPPKKTPEVVKKAEKTPMKTPVKKPLEAETIISPTTNKALKNMGKISTDLLPPITPLKTRPERPQAPKAKKTEQMAAPSPLTSVEPVPIQEEEEVPLAELAIPKRKAHAPKEGAPAVSRPVPPMVVEKVLNPTVSQKQEKAPAVAVEKALELPVAQSEQKKVVSIGDEVLTKEEIPKPTRRVARVTKKTAPEKKTESSMAPSTPSEPVESTVVEEEDEVPLAQLVASKKKAPAPKKEAAVVAKPVAAKAAEKFAEPPVVHPEEVKVVLVEEDGPKPMTTRRTARNAAKTAPAKKSEASLAAESTVVQKVEEVPLATPKRGAAVAAKAVAPKAGEKVPESTVTQEKAPEPAIVPAVEKEARKAPKAKKSAPVASPAQSTSAEPVALEKEDEEPVAQPVIPQITVRSSSRRPAPSKAVGKIPALKASQQVAIESAVVSQEEEETPIHRKDSTTAPKAKKQEPGAVAAPSPSVIPKRRTRASSRPVAPKVVEKVPEPKESQEAAPVPTMASEKKKTAPVTKKDSSKAAALEKSEAVASVEPTVVQEEEEVPAAQPVITRRRTRSFKEGASVAAKPVAPKVAENVPEPEVIQEKAPEPAIALEKEKEAPVDKNESQETPKAKKSEPVAAPAPSPSVVPTVVQEEEEEPVAQSITPRRIAHSSKEGVPEVSTPALQKVTEKAPEVRVSQESAPDPPPAVEEVAELEIAIEQAPEAPEAPVEEEDSPKTAISKMMARISQNASRSQRCVSLPRERKTPIPDRRRRKASVQPRGETPQLDKQEVPQPSTSRRVTRANRTSTVRYTPTKTSPEAKPAREVKPQPAPKEKTPVPTVQDDLQLTSDDDEEEVISPPKKKKIHVVSSPSSCSSSSDEGEIDVLNVSKNEQQEAAEALVHFATNDLHITLSDEEQEAAVDQNPSPQQVEAPEETQDDPELPGPSQPTTASVPKVSLPHYVRKAPASMAKTSLLSQVEKASKAMAKRLQSASTGNKRAPPGRQPGPMKIPTVSGRTAAPVNEEAASGPEVPVAGHSRLPEKVVEEKKTPVRTRAPVKAKKIEIIEPKMTTKTTRARIIKNQHLVDPQPISRPVKASARQLKRKATEDIFSPKKMKTTISTSEATLQKALDLGCDEQEITKKMSPEELEQIAMVGADRFAEIMLEYVIRMNRVDMWHSVVAMHRNGTPGLITNSLEENLLQISYSLSAEDADVITPFIRKCLTKLLSKSPMDDLLCHKIIRLLTMGYQAQMQISSSEVQEKMNKDLKALVVFLAFYRTNLLPKALVYMINRLPLEFLVGEPFDDVKRLFVLYAEDYMIDIFNVFWDTTMKKTGSTTAITLPTKQEVDTYVALNLRVRYLPERKYPEMRRILAARAVYLTTPKTFYVIMEDTRLLNDVLEEIHRGYGIGDKADDIVGSLFGTSSTSSLKDPPDTVMAEVVIRLGPMTAILDTIIRVTANIGQDKQKTFLTALSRSAEMAHELLEFMKKHLENASTPRQNVYNALRAFIKQCQYMTKYKL